MEFPDTVYVTKHGDEGEEYLVLVVHESLDDVPEEYDGKVVGIYTYVEEGNLSIVKELM
jgi:hypothetical protein